MMVINCGAEGPEGSVFELTGGALCLDFANTVDNRPTRDAKELLRSYADLVAWSRQAGIINGDQAGKLYRKAEREPSAAGETLSRARALREALFAIFSSSVDKHAPPAESLDVLNTEIPAALSSQAIEKTDKGYRLEGTEEENALDRMLAPVVRSAVDLLTSHDLTRIRLCAADDCGWLFLDRSRNRSRQWCDMTVCGNRAKARRYYRRSKEGASAGRS
jgi:predicted RNA-binding Zn ribbon-like protein